MRPLLLKLENFGPFLNETIDFERIEANQLFLISGKTGSGKTMIFDAIVYALYGRASTTAREVTQLRSHFAPPEQPLKVIYEFEVQQQRYKVVRTASFTKPNKKTETPGILEVYKAQGSAYVLEESKINKGNQYLKELMKLKVEQFRQLFILPQGEFKSFLVSKSQDKQPILRTLFNSVMYEDLKNELKNKTKSIQDEMDKTYDRLATYWQDLYAMDNETLQDYLKIDINQHERLYHTLPEFEKVGQHQLNVLKLQKTDMEKKCSENKEKIDQEQLRQQYQKELLEIEKNLESLVAQKNEIEQLEQQIDRIKQSQLAIHTFNDIEVLKKELENSEELIEVLNAKRDKLKDEMHQSKRKRERLEKQEQDVVAKEQTIKATHHYMQNKSDILKAFEDKQTLREQNTKLTNELRDNQSHLHDVEDDLEIQAQDFSCIDSLKEEQFTLRHRLEKIEHIEKQYKHKIQLTQQLGELTQTLKDLEAQKMKLSEQKHHFSEADQTVLSHEEMVHTLRSQLTEDVPCPVCGQQVHEIPSEQSLKLLKEQQKENEALDNEMRIIEEKLISHKTSLDHTQTQLAELKEVENPETQKRETLEQKKENATQITKLTEAKLEFEKLQSKQQRYLEKVQTLEQQMEKNQYQREIAEQKVSQFQQATHFDHYAEFETFFRASEQEVNDFRKAYQNIKEMIQKENETLLVVENDLKHQKERKESDQARLKKLEITLKREMDKLHLRSLDALNELKSEISALQTYESRVETFHQARQQLTTQQKTLVQKLDVLPEHDLNALQLKYDSLKKEQDDIIQRLNEIHFQVEENEKKSKKIREILDYIQHALSEHKAIFNLSEVISGKNNQNLTLENYVLIHYLENILTSANKRLLNMTGQRYELVRKEEKGRGLSGLEIEVFDYYSNQSRHITSLSGGETFQASLALALGLNEVVQNEQGGISLDTMFIDEGFGTLDQETLETAMDTLIQLQSSGRLVGIISHVTELKSRIPLILEVNSSNYQSSTSLKFND